MNISFKVENQLIERTDEMTVVADSRNYLYADFEFSPEWTGTVTAVFKNEGVSYTAVLDSENKCTVPWEVITEGRFSVSCFCGNRITANRAYVDVLPSGYEEGETPAEPTPDAYANMVSIFEGASQKADAVYTAYRNGELKGEKGDKGDRGETGAFFHRYSLQETQVGEWIDGKPVYELTFHLNITESTELDISSLNIDTVVQIQSLNTIEGVVSGDYRINNRDYVGTTVEYGTNLLFVAIGNNTIPEGESAELIIVIRYTKTTDTAVSG